MGTLSGATVTPHQALTSVPTTKKHLAASTPNCTGSAALPLVHLFIYLNIFHIVHLPPLRLQPPRALPLLFLLQRYLPFAPPAASASRPALHRVLPLPERTADKETTIAYLTGAGHYG